MKIFFENFFLAIQTRKIFLHREQFFAATMVQNNAALGISRHVFSASRNKILSFHHCHV
jgi:hypothetical protein